MARGLHRNAHRFLVTLECVSSKFYNPHAASIIRRLLQEVARVGGNRRAVQREHLIVLFMGQIETLLLSTCGGQDRDSILNMYEGFVFDDMSAFRQISKVSFHEKIDSLLYGKPERTIYAIESYYPSVSFTDSSASLIVYSSVMRYLAGTPDMERRRRKLDFLERLSQDASQSDDTRRVCRSLAACMRSHLDEVNTGGGEAFDRMFRRLVANCGFDRTLVDRCIRARNKAVHEGRCQCGDDVLCLQFTMLFGSQVGESSANESARLQIEQKVETAVSGELVRVRTRKALSAAVIVAVVALFGYLVGMFVAGSYIGESDIERVRWNTESSQFNARMNELIATKDTSELLRVQHDLQWIDNYINQPAQNSTRQ